MGADMIEASFYRDLAASLPVRMAECWYAHHDPETNAYIVVLGTSLRPSRAIDARFSPADIDRAIDELVLLHGRALGRPDAARHRVAEPWTGDVGPMVGLLELGVDCCFPRALLRAVSTLRRWPRRLFMPGFTDDLSYGGSHGRSSTFDFHADDLLFGNDRVVVVDGRTVNLEPAPATSPTCSGPACSRRSAARRKPGSSTVRGRGEAQGVVVDRDDIWPLLHRYALSGLVMRSSRRPRPRRPTVATRCS